MSLLLLLQSASLTPPGSPPGARRVGWVDSTPNFTVPVPGKSQLHLQIRGVGGWVKQLEEKNRIRGRQMVCVLGEGIRDPGKLMFPDLQECFHLTTSCLTPDST